VSRLFAQFPVALLLNEPQAPDQDCVAR
jgi:hypothetical protein